jgi:hypothetical protein
LSGRETDENIYFAYSATLRIFGNIPDLHKSANVLASHQLARTDGATEKGLIRPRMSTICGATPLR